MENTRRERILNPEPERIRLRISEACLRYLEHCQRRGFKLNTVSLQSRYYKKMIHYWQEDFNIEAVNP